MSYLENLRVIIGGGVLQKVPIIQNCTTSETGKHLFCKPQKVGLIHDTNENFLACGLS